MRKRIVSVGLALLMIILALVAAVALPGNRKLLSGLKPASVNVASRVSQTGWVLREYQGRIGVFAEGGEKPQQVLNVYITSLPEEDQQQLRQGIHASSKTELLSLIENYSS